MESANTRTQAEKTLLGSLLLDNKLMIECFALKPEHFSIDFHRRLFSAMQELDSEGSPFDVITIGPKMGTFYDIAAISDLMEGSIERPSVKYWAEIIFDAAKRRALVQQCIDCIAELDDPICTTTEALDALETSILTLRAAGRADKASHVKEIVSSVLNALKAQKSRQEGLPGFTVGLKGIDDITTGIREGEYWVIGAAPSRGKTVLGTQIAALNAVNGVPTLFFSYEMTAEQLVKRMLPNYAMVPSHTIRDFRYANEEQVRFTLAAGAEISMWPLWVVDPEGMTAGELSAIARLHIRRNKVRLIIVDYLQIIDSKGLSRREKIGSVSDVLRSLAKQENVSIVALSQLRRPASEDERPTMFHLKETGDIESHAHCILLLYRPKDEQGRWTGMDEIIIAKQREGLVGTECVLLDERRLWFVAREA